LALRALPIAWPKLTDCSDMAILLLSYWFPPSIRLYADLRTVTPYS